MEKQQEREIGDTLIREKLATSYDVFERDSMIPADLKGASYKTFTVSSDIDQQAKNFAMRLNRFYFKEGGKGNALIVGQSGIGKSHLTISIRYNKKSQGTLPQLIVSHIDYYTTERQNADDFFSRN